MRRQSKEDTRLLSTPEVVTGHYGSLTPEQKQALEQLRVALPSLPPRYTELMLLRFLRARQFDVSKTVEMITNDIAWRKEVGADEALKTFPNNKYYQSLLNYWPGRNHKHDKRGVHIYYERVGVVDPKSLITSIPEDDIIKFHIYLMETGESVLLKETQTVPLEQLDMGVVIIEDLTDLGRKHLYAGGLNVIKRIAQIDQDHYPETLKKMIFVNAPSVFTLVWNFVSPWLDPITQAKMVICGSTDFRPLLQNEGITDEDLPEYLGGKCKCEGGCVPGGGIYLSKDAENAKSVQVAARDKHTEKIVVEEPSILQYFVKTDGYDIGFVIHDTVQKKSLVNTMCTDRATVEEITVSKGEYIVSFDNTHSMLRKKLVQYHLKLRPAEPDNE